MANAPWPFYAHSDSIKSHDIFERKEAILLIVQRTAIQWMGQVYNRLDCGQFNCHYKYILRQCVQLPIAYTTSLYWQQIYYITASKCKLDKWSGTLSFSYYRQTHYHSITVVLLLYKWAISNRLNFIYWHFVNESCQLYSSFHSSHSIDVWTVI